MVIPEKGSCTDCASEDTKNCKYPQLCSSPHAGPKEGRREGRKEGRNKQFGNGSLSQNTPLTNPRVISSSIIVSSPFINV